MTTNTNIHTLSPTSWNCKYHIVFAPKYRRKVFYNEKRQGIGSILRSLCKWKTRVRCLKSIIGEFIHLLYFDNSYP